MMFNDLSDQHAQRVNDRPERFFFSRKLLKKQQNAEEKNEKQNTRHKCNEFMQQMNTQGIIDAHKHRQKDNYHNNLIHFHNMRADNYQKAYYMGCASCLWICVWAARGVKIQIKGFIYLAHWNPALCVRSGVYTVHCRVYRLHANCTKQSPLFIAAATAVCSIIL